eukprot:scaffold148546_cov22-Tisochrysis_lutea.AAC.1
MHVYIQEDAKHQQGHVPMQEDGQQRQQKQQQQQPDVQGDAKQRVAEPRALPPMVSNHYPCFVQVQALQMKMCRNWVAISCHEGDWGLKLCQEL